MRSYELSVRKLLSSFWNCWDLKRKSQLLQVALTQK